MDNFQNAESKFSDGRPAKMNSMLHGRPSLFSAVRSRFPFVSGATQLHVIGGIQTIRCEPVAIENELTKTGFSFTYNL
jgi:hypothetical protein